MKQLKHRHQLLEFQHCLAPVGLQHEAEGTDARVRAVGGLGIALQDREQIVIVDQFFTIKNMQPTWKEVLASVMALSIKSLVIFLEGCSLKTEFIRAILAALRLASALVGQF